MKILLVLVLLLMNLYSYSQTYILEQYKSQYDTHYTNINNGYNYLHIVNDSLFVDVDLYGESIIISGKIKKSNLNHTKNGKIYKYKVDNKYLPKTINLTIHILGDDIIINIYKKFNRFEDIKFESRIADEKDLNRLNFINFR